MYNKIPKVTNKDIASELSNIASKQNKEDLFSSIEGTLELARKALNEGNILYSLILLDEGLIDFPESSQLVKERAKIYIIMEDYKEALENVEYMLQIDPQDEDALMARNILNEKLRYQKLVLEFPLYA